MAKCIKHAFKSYPKIKIGGGTMLQSDAVDQPSTSPYDVVQDPYGGIDNVENEQQIEQEQSFGPQPQTVGVTIDNTADPEDDGAF
jgi:hypothetical protein